jgi:hypothetical protein
LPQFLANFAVQSFFFLTITKSVRAILGRANSQTPPNPA